MKFLGNGLLLLIPGLVCLSGVAAEEDWELRRDRDGIQVYTRDVPGSSHDEVRTVTEVNGVTLSSLVALIQDAEACPNWADRCEESYIVERVAPNEAYVYAHNDMPWPVKDRDVVSHAVWTQDPGTLVVEMSGSAVSGKVDEISGRVRLTEAEVGWRFEPLGDGRIRVSNQVHLNPGSALPGWVTNLLLVDTPFETMQAFIAEVRKPRYQNAELNFIQNH